jgi:hypothetical protein
MSDYKPCSAPVDTQAKLSEDDGPRSPTRQPIGASLVLSNTGHSPDLTSPTPFNMCAFTCTPHETPPHRSQADSSLPSRLHRLQPSSSELDYSLLLRPSPTSELVVCTDADWVGCPDTPRFTSDYVVFLGANHVFWPRSGSPSSLASTLRPSIARCGQWSRPPGSASFSRSSTTPSSAPLSSTAKMSARSTSPPIPCNISARNTWRLTFTSSSSVSPPVMFAFSASRPCRSH